MKTKGNCHTTKPLKCALLGVFVAAWSCPSAYAQQGPAKRSRPPEGLPPAEVGGQRPPGRGLGPRGGPGETGLQGPLGRPKPWNETPEAERKQVERFMEEHFPRLYVEMQRLKDRDEDRYSKRMSRIAPQMRKIMETMRTDPQRGTLMIRERKVEFEIQQTIARFRGAKDDEARRQIREHLDELVSKSFDCRNERRQMEVRELEARLSELHNRLLESEKLRPELIRERVSELLKRRPPRIEGEDREPLPEGPGAEPE